MIHERHLFGPGPSNPYPEATYALSRPLLGHLDPEFLRIIDETCELLRQAWGTTNARTLPLSATGSAGMEAAFVNTVHDGDVVVVGVNGLFGVRMCDVAARCGAEVVAVELAAEGHRLPELTTVKVPDGVDSAAVRARLLERHGIEIGAGVGQYAATVWRIGLMGHNARPDAALLVLAALEEAI